MIDKLFKITEELTQVLQQEHVYLNNRMLTQASQLHKEKDRLNGEYQLIVSQVKKNIGALKRLNPGALETLTQNTAALQTLLESNKKHISLVATANQRILISLANALSKKPAQVPSYSSLGAIVSQTKQRVEALAFNGCI